MSKKQILLFLIVFFFIFITGKTEADDPVYEPERGWLGVSVQNITPELAQSFSLKDERGSLVVDVLRNSPAEQAGFKSGDVIIEFDGKPVVNVIDFRYIVAYTQIGKTVPVRIIREGSAIFLTVTIQQSPDISSEVPETSIVPKEEKKPSEKIDIPDDLGDL